MGLTRLQDFVTDSSERLRLITCIFRHKIAMSTGGVSNANSDRQNVDSPSTSFKKGSDSDSDFNPNDFLNTGEHNESEEHEVPLINLRKVQEVKVVKPAHCEPNKDLHNCVHSEGTSSNQEKEIQAVNAVSNPILINEGRQTFPSPGALPSRLQSIVSKGKIRYLDLNELLRSNTISATVFIGNKNGVLTPENRKTLVKIVSEYILNQTTRPTSQDFIAIRDKIYELFSNEPKGLYYVAPRENGPHQSLARGKIFDRVRNTISRLIKQNAITPLRKRTAVCKDNTESPENNEDDPSTEVQASILVLKRTREVHSDVEEKWKACADFRLKKIYRRAKNSNNKKTAKISKNHHDLENNQPDIVVEYFDEFKILKHPRGYLLLLSDFKHLFENEDQNLFAEWPDIQKQIKHLALNSKIDDPIGIELLSQLKEDTLLDENSRDAILLQLLLSLCPPTARVNVGKTCFKPSINEARDAFICHTTVAADLEPLIERRRKRKTDLRAPLQPYMIFLGPNRSNITAAYIAIDRVLCKLDSTLQCLDTCFKIFHSVCTGYPKEANHLWHIFHLHVYNIKHDSSLEGDVPMSTQSFIASLKSL